MILRLGGKGMGARSGERVTESVGLFGYRQAVGKRGRFRPLGCRKMVHPAFALKQR